ncbi:MAG: DUF3426 domain-containing protein [Ramlibacter sp.]
MSLITRCPACGTLFKVVPDQLKISEGWVRCGHCAEVFDATAHLQGDTPITQPDPLSAADGKTARPVGAAESVGFESSLNTEVGEGAPSEAPDSEQLAAEALALAEHPLDRPFELRRQENGGLVEPPQRSEPRPAPEPEPELDDLAFVQLAQRKAFWSRPSVRVLMFLVLLAFGALLSAQVAIHNRDRLAVVEPGLRPWLARLCEPLKCTIGAPRQIDAIAIDSSSFNKLRGDAYRLNVTVKNQAATQVALPALELTLTDGQDQAIVRRVLMPSEFANPGPGTIAPGSEWSGSMALAAGGVNGRIAGYRLLAFYP